MPPDVAPMICSYCHQSIQSAWYFCPNCGNKLQSAPLSTTLLTQLGIYAFSIILPVICFLAITKWPGQKYFKSADAKTHAIGIVAWVLLVISTIVTFWLAYVWIQNSIQTTESQLNTEMSL